MLHGMLEVGYYVINFRLPEHYVGTFLAAQVDLQMFVGQYCSVNVGDVSRYGSDHGTDFLP
jgi:hypothetical protein